MGGDMKLLAQYKQLNVRHFSISDKHDFIHLVQHPLCMKYSSTGVLSEQQANEFFDAILCNKKHYMYAIEDASQGSIIGCTGLQECCIEDDINSYFILRLLPEYQHHQDINTVLLRLINNLIYLHELPQLQTVIAKNNHFSLQRMSDLNFKKIKSMTCRGIDSYLYQSD